MLENEKKKLTNSPWQGDQERRPRKKSTTSRRDVSEERKKEQNCGPECSFLGRGKESYQLVVEGKRGGGKRAGWNGNIIGFDFTTCPKKGRRVEKKGDGTVSPGSSRKKIGYFCSARWQKKKWEGSRWSVGDPPGGLNGCSGMGRREEKDRKRPIAL